MEVAQAFPNGLGCHGFTQKIFQISEPFRRRAFGRPPKLHDSVHRIDVLLLGRWKIGEGRFTFFAKYGKSLDACRLELFVFGNGKARKIDMPSLELSQSLGSASGLSEVELGAWFAFLEKQSE